MICVCVCVLGGFEKDAVVGVSVRRDGGRGFGMFFGGVILQYSNI